MKFKHEYYWGFLAVCFGLQLSYAFHRHSVGEGWLYGIALAAAVGLALYSWREGRKRPPRPQQWGAG
jgi:hypothetical protein